MTLKSVYLKKFLLIFMVGFQLVQSIDSPNCQSVKKWVKEIHGKDRIKSIILYVLQPICPEATDGCESLKEVCLNETRIDYKNDICYPKRELNGICVMNEQCERDLECVERKQCKNGFSSTEDPCFKAEKIPDKECFVDCRNIGTANVKICDKKDRRNTTKSSGKGLIERGAILVSLPNDIPLGGQCEKDEQCTGTENARICKQSSPKQNKTCHCNEEFITFNSNCIPGRISVGYQCEIDKQCTGTKDAGICRNDTPMENKTCHCNAGFKRSDSECFQVGKKLYEICNLNEQCNGTVNANVCTSLGDIKICHCTVGMHPFLDNCFKDTTLFLLTILSNLMLFSILKCILRCLNHYFKTGRDIEKHSEMKSETLKIECELSSDIKYPYKNGNGNVMKIANCIEVDDKSKSKLEIFFSKFMTDYALSWERRALKLDAFFIIPIFIISRMQDDVKKVNEYLDKYVHKKQRILLVAIHNCHKDNIKMRSLCKTPPNEKIYSIINIYTWKNEFYTCDANVAASKTLKNFFNSDGSSL